MILTPASLNVEIPETFQKSLDAVLSDNSPSLFHKLTGEDYHFLESEKLSNTLLANYAQFVVIGVGGSSMGARAIVEMAAVENIHFLDNVDSSDFESIWNKVSSSLDETAFIVISKSGSTIEVLWNYSMLESLAQKIHKKSLVSQTFFISETVGNPLSDYAKMHGRPLLEIPIKVGGRFSVLSAVGLVIAGLCKVDITKLRIGAKNALSSRTLVMQLCQAFQNSFARHENISLFWFYHSNFRWFGCWLQQLWAESLGKKTTRSGENAPPFSVPVIAIGSTDQHSILQQVAHGPKDKFVCIFDFKSAQNSQFTLDYPIFKEIEFLKGRNYGELISSQSKATYEALKQNNISCELFFIEDKDKSITLGYLFMLFQLVVATLGEHNDINAFDQPGVALGKEISLKILNGQKINDI